MILLCVFLSVACTSFDFDRGYHDDVLGEADKRFSYSLNPPFTNRFEKHDAGYSFSIS